MNRASFQLQNYFLLGTIGYTVSTSLNKNLYRHSKVGHFESNASYFYVDSQNKQGGGGLLVWQLRVQQII